MAVTLLFVFLTVAGLATGRIIYLETFGGASPLVWVGIQGDAGMGQPDNGGFFLSSQTKIEVPEGWRGRIWARTMCRFGASNLGHCGTGDCGNKLECNGNGSSLPVTMIQITLNGPSGLDYYNVSLVNGFNVRARIEPYISPDRPDGYYCSSANCTVDLNRECPDDLRVWYCGNVVGCKSSCLAYNTDEYCCRGAFNDPNICKSSPSAVYFKSNCPGAYSYPYDDGTSSFTCHSTDYIITFG